MLGNKVNFPIVASVKYYPVRTSPIAEEVVEEGEKQIDRRKRKKVTQLKNLSNCSEKFS